MSVADDDRRLEALFAAAAAEIPAIGHADDVLNDVGAVPQPIGSRLTGRRTVLAVAAGLLVAVSIAAVWMRGGSSDQLVSLSYEEYFGSFSADYDPAGTRTDLASRSELVVEATLVDVIDGPVFGSSATDPSASKHALFVFEAESTRDPIAVMLQRPNTSDIEALRDAMPIGGRAVLYLVAAPPIPDNERDFWFNVDDGLARWYPTTPQGLILERASDDGTSIVDLPLEGGINLEDAPESGSDIGDWLPPGGEILPDRLGTQARP